VPQQVAHFSSLKAPWPCDGSVMRNVETMQFGYGFEYGYGKSHGRFVRSFKSVHKSIEKSVMKHLLINQGNI
jgi:hypothetical protein